jgi:hypothetical protein
MAPPSRCAIQKPEVERVRFIYEDWFRPPPHPEVKKRPRWRRRKQDCMDCGVDCSFGEGGCGHYYTVLSEVWRAAVPGLRGELCLDFLEARLGRRLRAADFVATPFEIWARMHGKDAVAQAALEARGGLRDDRQLDLPLLDDC